MWRRIGNATLSPTDIESNSAAFWNRKPMCFRTSASSRPASVVMSRSSTNTFPAVRPHEPDDVAEGHALAGAAASEQAERLTRRNLERNVVEHLQRSERLGDVIESHGVHPDTGG